MDVILICISCFVLNVISAISRGLLDSLRYLSDNQWFTDLPARVGPRTIHEHWLYRGLEDSSRIARLVKGIHDYSDCLRVPFSSMSYFVTLQQIQPFVGCCSQR